MKPDVGINITPEPRIYLTTNNSSGIWKLSCSVFL
ncbi:hypothetical protein NNRS527_02923 [Nitrosospira sp. NRS527]|nr:hypothetical protein NNRS527_02923 [Nitrosospira sp. NRS527]